MADIQTKDGHVITVHCPNSGRMTGLLEAGNLCLFSKSPNKNRKYPHTLEMIKENNKEWVGINTMKPNNFVSELLHKITTSQSCEELKSLQNIEFDQFKKESSYKKDVRFDFAFYKDKQIIGYGEVKNVHWKVDGKATFPDSPTDRGCKHLKHLIEVMRTGLKAFVFYVIQRSDCHSFQIAEDIDPKYSLLYKQALEIGLNVICIHYKLSDEQPYYILKSLS